MKKYIVKEYEMEDYEKVSKEMTNEDVVNLLEYIKRGHLPDYGYSGSESDMENYKLHVAMSKAIQAMK